MSTKDKLEKKGIEVRGNKGHYDIYSKGQKLNGRKLTDKELKDFERTVEG